MQKFDANEDASEVDAKEVDAKDSEAAAETVVDTHAEQVHPLSLSLSLTHTHTDCSL